MSQRGGGGGGGGGGGRGENAINAPPPPPTALHPKLWWCWLPMQCGFQWKVGLHCHVTTFKIFHSFQLGENAYTMVWGQTSTCTIIKIISRDFKNNFARFLK